MYEFEVDLKKTKQGLKAERIKMTKELEKKYSLELIQLYKERQEKLKGEEEFKEVLDEYVKKVEEIDFLKKQLETIKDNMYKSTIEAEKQLRVQEENFKNMERKKKEFETFMNQRGKAALEYVKRKKQLDKEIKEELTRIEAKKQVRSNETDIAKQNVQNYKDQQLQKKLEEERLAAENPRSMYKVKQAFHYNGNNIDYSTTRFHNIVVVRHEDELNEFISAQELAQKEEKKTEERKKSAKHSKEAFNKKTQENSLKELKKMQAQENLKKLNEEVKKLNDARKCNRNKQNNIIDSRPNYAKNLNHRSEKLLTTLLEEKKKERRSRSKDKAGYKSTKQIEPVTIIEKPEDFSRFYDDPTDSNIDMGTNEDEKPNYEENRDIIVENYEKPVTAEMKEYINRLNPVDLDEYRDFHYESKNLPNSNNFYVLHPKADDEPQGAKYEYKGYNPYTINQNEAYSASGYDNYRSNYNPGYNAYDYNSYDYNSTNYNLNQQQQNNPYTSAQPIQKESNTLIKEDNFLPKKQVITNTYGREDSYKVANHLDHIEEKPLDPAAFSKVASMVDEFFQDVKKVEVKTSNNSIYKNKGQGMFNESYETSNNKTQNEKTVISFKADEFKGTNNTNYFLDKNRVTNVFEGENMNAKAKAKPKEKEKENVSNNDAKKVKGTSNINATVASSSQEMEKLIVVKKKGELVDTDLKKAAANVNSRVVSAKTYDAEPKLVQKKQTTGKVTSSFVDSYQEEDRRTEKERKESQERKKREKNEEIKQRRQKMLKSKNY